MLFSGCGAGKDGAEKAAPLSFPKEGGGSLGKKEAVGAAAAADGVNREDEEGAWEA